MCEILVTVWPEPQPFARVMPWALELEHLGVAGFGWGAAWRDGKRIRSYRDPGRMASDGTGRAALGSVYSTHFLVHLRRPSCLTSIGLADTQPFLADDGSFAMAHNGRLEGADRIRQRFQARLQGQADSEVGFRLFDSKVSLGAAPGEALKQVHQELGGRANFAYLPGGGPALVYAGNPDNAFWRFRMEGAEVAATSLHSADEAIFKLCFPAASQRDRVAWQAVVDLVATGRPTLDPVPRMVPARD
ncbi:MAG TPA: class II glutamine amidotransferase [Chloroflexota bacterium]|nr:class II glutamine amidotransferase [Chloroflexota bacterium]